MRTDKNNGYFLIFAGGVLWGFIGLFVKQMGAGGADPITISFLRVLFAAVIMLPICICRGGLRSLSVDSKTLLICVLLGVICHGIYNIFYSYAVTIAGVSISAVLLNIAPVFTLLFSVLFFSEKITAWKVIAIVINILGCILAATGGRFHTAAFSLIGILFGLGAGLCYAMTAILGRFASDRTDPFVMSLYSYAAAALLLLFWSLFKNGSAIRFTSGSSRILLWGFLFALIPTAIAYILYYAGIQKVRESSKVPVIASVETVVAAVIGILVYKEKLNFFSLLGVALVLISIVLMNRRQRTQM